MAYVEQHENGAEGSSEQKRKKSNTTPTRLLLRASIALTVISLLGALFLLILRPAGQQLGCQQTLRYTWHMLFEDYFEKDAEGRYPPLSGVPGVFAPDYDAVKPFISEENGVQLFCPTAHTTHGNLSVQAQLRQPTYAYFGYVFHKEDELLAFLERYPMFITEGADFNDDLVAPPGRGSFGGDMFRRLRKGGVSPGEQEMVRNPIVLMEIPHQEKEKTLPHPGYKGNTLESGGSMKSITYGESYPMTPAIIARICELRLMYADEDSATTRYPFTTTVDEAKNQISAEGE